MASLSLTPSLLSASLSHGSLLSQSSLLLGSHGLSSRTCEMIGGPSLLFRGGSGGRGGARERVRGKGIVRMAAATSSDGAPLWETLRNLRKISNWSLGRNNVDKKSKKWEDEEEFEFDPLELKIQKRNFPGIGALGKLQATGRSSAASIEDKSLGPGDFFGGELPKKYLSLLGLLALSRIGIYIPLWGVNREAFSNSLGEGGEGSLLSTLDTLSGGGIGRLGLFSLGIVPYINAQIIFQLLGVLYPKLQELQKKEGEAGRKKVQRWTKFAAVGFGFVQAIGQVAFIQPYVYDYSPAWQLSAVLGLTLGSFAVISIGDKITDLKLGNGTSLLIFTSIVSYLPATFGRTWQQAIGSQNYLGLGTLLGAFVFLVFGIVYVQEAERKIPINYAQRFTVQMKKAAYLPFKVNSTGVMPIIFASSLMAAPSSLARFTGSPSLQNVAVALDPGGPGYLVLYISFIAFFNYYYTFLQLDPADVSDQLKRQGASIPLVRPGKATAAYITDVLAKISVLGSGFLAGMATAPTIVESITHLQAFRGFAGTSILILVGSATDSARKVGAEVISNKYKGIDLLNDPNNADRLPPR